MLTIKRLLAGDVGGTKTVLCLYDVVDGRLEERVKRTYVSGEHEHFNDLVLEFLAEQEGVDLACLGIAGPVKDGHCDTTNLPWQINALSLQQACEIPKVLLINDLQATAYGVLQLPDDALLELNPNAVQQPGHKAVLAAGTGLGEAVLFFDGNKHVAMPSEGGHTDFAAQTQQQDALLVFLRKRLGGHVSYERILSGDGFGLLYDFLAEADFAPRDPALAKAMEEADRNALISARGLVGEDEICAQALGLFCEIYGAEAGNLALKSLPLGGLYVAGGIAPKIQQALIKGEFLRAYLNKGRMTKAIEHIPLRLVLDPQAPLLGAAYWALHG